MTGVDFLKTAYQIAQELFPAKHTHSFTEEELEGIIEELEDRTGYVRKAEYRQ